jgi:homoisocitrate dehydrogenase
VALRKELDLYANIRPVLSVRPTPIIPVLSFNNLPEQVSPEAGQKSAVDLVVVRENTECLVSLEY